MNNKKNIKNIETRSIKIPEFFALIEHVSNQKNIKQEEVIKIIKDAIIKSFHLNLDPDALLEINIDAKEKLFKMTNSTTYVIDDKSIVDKNNKMIEINLRDAKKIDPNAKEGDTVVTEIDFSLLRNEITNQISQLFRQELTKKHKEIIYDKYKTLKGEIIEAEVISVLPQQVLFKIENKVEASMPNYMRNNRQPLSPGQIVEVYVEDVKEMMGKGSQIIVSNGSIEIVKRFLEIEIPEIEDGTIDVIVVARIPGFKSKIAIKSNNPNVDAAGAVIGPRGSRINTVSEHLFGERIDVIIWSGNINQFIANSISPAKAIAVLEKNEEETTGGKLIIVPNRHQTLAIGRGGTNIRLASHLTKEKLDVISLSQAKERGIEFEWNGNVSPEVVEQIERGERIQFNKRPQRQNIDSMSSLDEEISSFTEDIAEFDSSSELKQDEINYNKQSLNKNSYNNYDKTQTNKTHGKSLERKGFPKKDYQIKIDEDGFDDADFDYDKNSDFSDEDLKKMEEEFGFGDFDLNEFKNEK